RFARDFVSWHCGVEELVVVALNFSLKGRAAPIGKKATPLPGDTKTLQYYLGSDLYDPNLDINLVECSCTDDVRKRLRACG
ncbi:hypothetical protein NL529_33195, partial [Klebsiella pneumoniae]|nr:hypothetical protein [Klebsiella pneumoniae]